MILYKSEKLPEKLEEKIIEDSKKEFKPITSYTLVNGSIDGYFYKKINMPKVRNRYNGDYVHLLIEYYLKLSKLIPCNKLIEIFSDGDDVYEISNLIDNNTILCDNNNISFTEMKELFCKVLDGINRMEYDGDKTLGIDSAIWNYTKSGTFFDYDPPKILREDSLFITPDDDYKKRVLYRNFNYNGMKANALGTIFLGNSNWNFNITELSKFYVNDLITIFLESIENIEIREQFRNQIFGDEDVKTFQKHPINIVRKELRK